MKKLIAAAPKYTLKIEGVGYLSNSQNFLSGINFTDDVKKAEVFAHGFDNPLIKLGIWNAEAKRLFNNPDVKFNLVNLC